MWIPFLLRYKIQSNEQRHKMEEIARVISQFDLNYEEVELINRVEGWDYQKNTVVRFNNDDLKETYLLSKNIQIENESYEKVRILIGIIVSFVMSLIFIGGFQNWESDVYWPMLCGILLLGLSIYLMQSYRDHKHRVDILKDKIANFKLSMRLQEDRSQTRVP